MRRASSRSAATTLGGVGRIRPTFSIFFNDPSGAFKYDLSLLGLWDRALARHTFVNTEFKLTVSEKVSGVTQPSNSTLPHVRSDVAEYKRGGDFKMMRALLQQLYHPAPRVYARGSAGFYEEMYAGAGGERPGPPRRFVFLGGAGDRGDVEATLAVLRPAFPLHRFENRCGELGLGQSLAVLAAAEEFWGIDSGLLHYARLLRKPCLSFFGPTHPDTLLRPIEGLRERVQYHKVPCSPCVHVAEQPPCRGNNVCIRNLFERTPGKELEWLHDDRR